MVSAKKGRKKRKGGNAPSSTCFRCNFKVCPLTSSPFVQLCASSYAVAPSSIRFIHLATFSW